MCFCALLLSLASISSTSPQPSDGGVTDAEEGVALRKLALEAAQLLQAGRTEEGGRLAAQGAAMANRLGEREGETLMSMLAGSALSLTAPNEALSHLERARVLCAEQPIDMCGQVSVLLDMLYMKLGVPVSVDLEKAQAGDRTLSPNEKALIELAEAFDSDLSLDEQLQAIHGFFSGLDGQPGQEDVLAWLQKMTALQQDGPAIETRDELLTRLGNLIDEVPESVSESALPGDWQRLHARRAFAADDLDQALKHYQKAHETAVLAQFPTQQASILSELAGVHWQRGSRQEAVETLEEAIQVIETAEGSLRIRDPMTATLGRASARYREQLVQYHAWMNQPEAAFGVGERSKSRTLLYRLAGRGVDSVAWPTMSTPR